MRHPKKAIDELTVAKIIPPPSVGDQASAITDLTVTGTYATDDTPIETAINSILAAMRDVGLIAT